MSKKRKKSKEFLIKEMNLLPGDKVTFTLYCKDFMHLRLLGQHRSLKCSFPESFKPTMDDLRMSNDLQQHLFAHRGRIFENWDDFISSLHE